MEKLQAALEKARQTRAEHVRSAPTERVLPADHPPTSIPELWAALPSFEVDEKHLVQNLVFTRQAGTQAAPFDILRTKVLLQMRQNGWKRLAVTSPMPRAGKTTIACNLALSLGRQQDMCSMLFDLDLRDPSVHQFFQTRPRHSIGEVLKGDTLFADQAQCYRGNVAVSMANRSEPDPSQLLLAEETATVLDQIEAVYKPDVMIFDLPSVLVNDDTRAFVKNVDCALIVARSDDTRYAQFDTCERELGEQTNVLGTVLNAYRHGEKDAGGV
ncbi:Exopolysaccharide biosynthesis domain protein (plasmid) [Rhodovulum sp. P5]|uniref:CpsD/CapB family tyrosine-protein kinase n=1 Tax=Rhodovulum sp. P5 TaxID=1564506 RepID=UPI0009C3B527|nr:CpsD/CapB family tyrosine-protein kinase [Rhodovulum sp. P5]ARE42514.1 Exopolysaccharide biosynthesis domain protein [Rhodovulum sp. P5]